MGFGVSMKGGGPEPTIYDRNFNVRFYTKENWDCVFIKMRRKGVQPRFLSFRLL